MAPSHRVRARAPAGPVRPPALLRADDVGAYLEDAAHTPGGHTPVVALPRTEGEVAWTLREAPAVLPVGAQSSLTGGATPRGEWVLSLARMDGLGAIGGAGVRVEPGLVLSSLEDALRPHGLAYPPVPTFRGATVGGTVATNAAGASTFKYGSTRRWVRALTVVLADGGVLDLARGAVCAHPEGHFEVESLAGDVRRLSVPTYRMPDVAKRSAGYHAEPEMDLVDLFIGSEGTLGVVTAVELALVPARPRLVGWVAFPAEAAALRAVTALREASRRTWAEADPLGIDVAAIESLDRRCLDLLREDGALREHGVEVAPDADTVLLFQAELPAGTSGEDAADAIALLDDPAAADGSLRRLLLLLRAQGALEELEVALPGDRRRAEHLLALREEVPLAVNRRVARARRAGHPEVKKTAADMIVPFPEVSAMMGVYREAFRRRGLDHALWGHVSDGNLHANALPRSAEDTRRGEEAILELGDEVLRRGGCPLSEHGVGRDRVKQELLRRLYGEEGIAQMRAVKAALDPGGVLSPGVLWPAY